MPELSTNLKHVAPVLELQGIRKSFNVGADNEIEVLHGIDMCLYPGDFCAVVGPSGSGKSTLLNTVGLLDRPSSGSLRITGLETTQLSDAQLTHLRGHSIGFVFQYHHLLSAFSALLDSVGMRPWLHAPANRLSGGQQQRVAVARALAMQPALILADEPTGNLDSKSADGVFALLRSVCKEHATAVLFVTHNQELSERCDRTIEVIDGRLWQGAGE